MKILIITPLLPPESGGPSYYAVALKKALEKKGNKVSILAFREVRKYPSVLRHILFMYRALWMARNVDVMYILDTVSVALPSVLAGFILNKKMVVRVGGDFVWERYIERTGDKVLLSEFYGGKRKITQKEKLLIWLQKNIVLKLATKIVFNTKWQIGIWQKTYALKKEKVSVIENAFVKNIDLYNSGGDTFLCAWRPTAFKNVDTLESAYKIAKEECGNKKVKLDIFKNIPRNELYKKMSKARALIIPSLSELSSNMALEALGMGLPVLLTKDCGVRELLGNAVVWIDPLSAHDIAEKMCKLMDEEEYKKAKEKAKGFSYKHTYDDIADEFLSLLSFGGSTPK